MASPAVRGNAASRARGLCKASSSAHYRNLIWIPRDQEDLVGSGCHEGRGAEAKPKPANPQHRRAFLELRQRIASEPDVPAPHSWAADGSKTPDPSAEGAGWPRSGVAATGSGLLGGSDQPQAFSLKRMRVPSPGPRAGERKRAPAATHASACGPPETAK